MIEIRGEWVNEIIKKVTEQHPHAPVQLTILTRALTLSAKTLGVDKDALLGAVATSYDVERPLRRTQQ